MAAIFCPFELTFAIICTAGTALFFVFAGLKIRPLVQRKRLNCRVLSVSDALEAPIVPAFPALTDEMIPRKKVLK